jgi:putative iron-regulated protein
VWGVCFAASLAVAAPARAEAPGPKAVLETYMTIAQAVFEDALSTAKDLGRAVDALLASPTDATLKEAREAWKKARIPYLQSEAYRFGNPLVDAWEGRVNAWPLDEGLIDYVDTGKYGETSDENPLFRANVIANTRIRVGRAQIDATTIDKGLLGKLHEAQGIEANVATGYHAIEFLLWGQDLNGTGPGAGNRPATDYSLTACTGGHCDRRRAYLQAATELLADDLGLMVRAWGPRGEARADLTRKGDNGGLATMLTGIGSLSYGELAGERMKLGLILHDPEEEQDCFSDNTHNSHFYDQAGMVAVYTGRYTRSDGRVVEGPSLAALASAKAPDEAKRLEEAMRTATEKLAVIKARADGGVEAYDQMIAEGNAAGNTLVQDGIDALVAQARAVERVVEKLGLAIKVQGSDSLDQPGKVGKK